MQIERINSIKNINTNYALNNKKIDQNFAHNNGYAVNSLEHLAALNKPNFTGKKYELGLSCDELTMRTEEKYLKTVTLLSPTSPEYLNLAEGDKKALKHLVKVADSIEIIEKKLDNKNNLPFEKYLEKEVKKGNKDAILTKKLYEGMKGVCGKDNRMNNISLIKGMDSPKGLNFYPEDLSVDEFHKILIKMLKAGKDEKVKNLLNQRTVVVRDGKELKGIDYVDMFSKEFKTAAKELRQAAKYSTNKDFNEYLLLQAKAFENADPMLDAKADMKWATLQDTPLELTIVRENYKDCMTTTIFENKELSELLKEHNINPIKKDNIGCRLGIVNIKGTDFILKSKEIMPLLAERMPYCDKYEQNITKDNKQTMVDADLIIMSGYSGECRGLNIVAENLPNNDKLSIKLGGGRRNVYHRQLRSSEPMAVSKQIVDNQKKYTDPKYRHMTIIGHENGHSLGPKDAHSMGKFGNIIEENKADVAFISFVDYLTDIGFYTEEERKGVLITFVLKNFLSTKPDITNAHKARSVIQAKFLEDNGVYDITPEGKIYINYDMVVPTAQKMLNEVIRIQMSNNYDNAKEYVDKYFVWTPKMQYIANEIKKSTNVLNRIHETPLADYLRTN